MLLTCLQNILEFDYFFDDASERRIFLIYKILLDYSLFDKVDFFDVPAVFVSITASTSAGVGFVLKNSSQLTNP